MPLESNQPHTSDKATDCWLKYINAPHKRWPVVPGRSRTVRQMQQFRRPSCPRWSSPPRGSPTTSYSFFMWFWWKEGFRPNQCKCHRALPPQTGLDWLGVVRRRSARRRREGSSSWSWSCAPCASSPRLRRTVLDASALQVKIYNSLETILSGQLEHKQGCL